MADAGRIERQLFLKTLAIGKATGAGQRFADAMREVAYPAGTTIYREGDGTDRIFFVRSGEISLARRGEEPWTFRERDTVGVLDAMQDRPRARTATAVTDVKALAVTVEDWLELLEDNFELARQTIVRGARSLFDLHLELAPTGGFPIPTGTDVPEGKGPVDLVGRIILLHDLPAFRAASVQSLVGLSKVLRERRLEAAGGLFLRGEPPGAIFVVVRGLVEISRDSPELRAGFGPGALVAGYVSVGQSERQFDARAVVPTTVLELREDDYLDLLEDHFELVRSVLADMARERERLMDLAPGRRNETGLSDRASLGL
ncbi:MAG: cyclic nucleotide-binding domain-containing protein [Deltaproteobacteria bacterium]|nr:cyclic nucleotide-binding domain-containing protein [Deltaproteobacteria bacterium]